MDLIPIFSIFFVFFLIEDSSGRPQDLREHHVPKVRNNDHSYIYIRKINTKPLLCSGALIKLTYAITAAKCVKKWEMSVSIYGGRQRGYEVVAGIKARIEGVPEWNDNQYVKRSFFDIEKISALTESSVQQGPEETEGTQVRTITLISIEKNYREDSPFINDLALLEVRESFYESNFVRPVAINSLQSSSAKINYGTVLTTFGVGKYTNGTPATELTYQEIEIVNPFFCGYGRDFTKWMCFKEIRPLPVNTHCDPGDPIFFRNVLVGITSWVSLVNRPGYYIAQNISTHEDYIQNRVIRPQLRKHENVAAYLFQNLNFIMFVSIAVYIFQ